MSKLEETELLMPATLAEALRLMADEKTSGVPLAGGTDLMVQWEAGARPAPARAISIKGLRELGGITDRGDLLDVGAGVTHAELRQSLLIQTFVPSLAAAAATVGGAQIQALGTLGGSVGNASPAGDLAPSLLVADASVIVASLHGERQIPIAGFLLGYRKIDLKPDELIVRFLVPKMRPGMREDWRKLGPRAAQAISKVMGSYRGRLDQGAVASFAVALGSVGPTAVRLRELEKWITGRRLDEATRAEAEQRAAAEVKPIADIRSTAEYRKWVSGRMVRGFLEHLAQE